MLSLAIWQAGARSQRPRRHPARSSALREGRVVLDPLRVFSFCAIAEPCRVHCAVWHLASFTLGAGAQTQFCEFVEAKRRGPLELAAKRCKTKRPGQTTRAEERKKPPKGGRKNKRPGLLDRGLCADEKSNVLSGPFGVAGSQRNRSTSSEWREER